MKTSGRIPTLDGWRCVAIVLVLITHFQVSYMHHNLFNAAWMDLGQHGVTIFFVLSGYLITSMLLAEQKISLTKFYLRRFLRLMPVAWTYLLVLVVISAFTAFHVNGGITGCLFFYRNYVPETSLNTCTEHFWSLSLEEQFYLLWPPILVLFGSKKSALVASVSIALIVLNRTLRWEYYMYDVRHLYSEVRADALLVGCILALLLQHEEVEEFFRRHSSRIFPICGVGLLVDIFFFHKLIPTHEDVFIALLIGSTVYNPSLFASRILEMDHLKLTGRVSYGIYIWQGLLLRGNLGIAGLILLPIIVALSWNFIEKPFMALGKKFFSNSLRPSTLSVSSG
jgi:peptidoglycan/LPS O-acetylase OafA/YrhL